MNRPINLAALTISTFLFFSNFISQVKAEEVQVLQPITLGQICPPSEGSIDLRAFRKESQVQVFVEFFWKKCWQPSMLILEKKPENLFPDIVEMLEMLEKHSSHNQVIDILFVELTGATEVPNLLTEEEAGIQPTEDKKLVAGDDQVELEIYGTKIRIVIYDPNKPNFTGNIHLGF
jgi:hypothetical protein